MPAASTLSRTCSARSLRRNCRGETLTQTCSTARPSACHAFMREQASRRAHSPICSMKPDSSASGMKREGEISPCFGCCQRMSASAAATAPVPSTTCGW